jgi:hypothetical protein
LLHHGSQDDMRRDAQFTREDLVRAIQARQQAQPVRSAQRA